MNIKLAYHIAIISSIILISTTCAVITFGVVLGIINSYSDPNRICENKSRAYIEKILPEGIIVQILHKRAECSGTIFINGSVNSTQGELIDIYESCEYNCKNGNTDPVLDYNNCPKNYYIDKPKAINSNCEEKIRSFSIIIGAFGILWLISLIGLTISGTLIIKEKDLLSKNNTYAKLVKMDSDSDSEEYN